VELRHVGAHTGDRDLGLDADHIALALVCILDCHLERLPRLVLLVSSGLRREDFGSGV
jgi:hypothetical protein